MIPIIDANEFRWDGHTGVMFAAEFEYALKQDIKAPYPKKIDVDGKNRMITFELILREIKNGDLLFTEYKSTCRNFSIKIFND